jgi:hypothetical protein
LGPLKEVITLKHLDLGHLHSSDTVKGLLSSIPQLRGLEEITFALDGDSDCVGTVEAMIGSFENDVSLERVDFTSHFIGEDGQSKI